jgi:hypothetical protein
MKLRDIVLAGMVAFGGSGCGSSRVIYKNSSDVASRLKPNEFVVPNDVFNAYVNEAGGTGIKQDFSFVGGVYISNPRNLWGLDDKLEELGYSSQESDTYKAMFEREGVIIINEKSLVEGTFESNLRHERVHKLLNDLPDEEYDHLIDVAKRMLGRKYTVKQAYDGGHITSEIFDLWKKMGEENKELDVVFSSDLRQIEKEACFINSEEFWTYLDQGSFIPRTEMYLRDEFPRAYEIFQKVQGQID